MFACLSLPASAAVAPGVEPDALEMVARAFSPRVEVHAAHFVSLDISGLGRLLGPPADIGRELVREVRQRGCAADVAIAASRTAAMLLALACDGLTVVAPGEEARKLANLPLGVLARLAAVAEAGSRQQAAGSGQQAAGSGQQAAGSRQQATGSGQQAAGSRQRVEIDESTNQQFNKSTDR